MYDFMKSCISLTDKYLNDKRKTRVKDAAFEFEESELEKMSIIIGMLHTVCGFLIFKDIMGLM